jgi:MFS transporter, FHS family, L-fucose permease
MAMTPTTASTASASNTGQIYRGPLAIMTVLFFKYVGGEVSVGSSIINFLGQPSIAGLDPVEASKYVSLFGKALAGRALVFLDLRRLLWRNCSSNRARKIV